MNPTTQPPVPGNAAAAAQDGAEKAAEELYKMTPGDLFAKSPQELAAIIRKHCLSPAATVTAREKALVDALGTAVDLIKQIMPAPAMRGPAYDEIKAALAAYRSAHPSTTPQGGSK